MTGSGSVLPSAAGLVVSIGAQGWCFTLRRADLRSADIFFKYHGKEIAAADVSRFLPNWRSLNWIQVPRSLLSPNELSAVDGEYAISLSGDSTGDMERNELVGAFLRFMIG